MKSKEEILNQLYVTPQDVKILLPKLGIDNCRKIIEELQVEMKNKNLFIPPSKKPRMALTKLLKKRMGI